MEDIELMLDDVPIDLLDDFILIQESTARVKCKTYVLA